MRTGKSGRAPSRHRLDSGSVSDTESAEIDVAGGPPDRRRKAFRLTGRTVMLDWVCVLGRDGSATGTAPLQGVWPRQLVRRR
jgi:hypothetical protein